MEYIKMSTKKTRGNKKLPCKVHRKKNQFSARLSTANAT